MTCFVSSCSCSYEEQEAKPRGDGRTNEEGDREVPRRDCKLFKHFSGRYTCYEYINPAGAHHQSSFYSNFTQVHFVLSKYLLSVSYLWRTRRRSSRLMRIRLAKRRSRSSRPTRQIARHSSSRSTVRCPNWPPSASRTTSSSRYVRSRAPALPLCATKPA